LAPPPEGEAKDSPTHFARHLLSTPPSGGSTARRAGRGVKASPRSLDDREVDHLDHVVEFLVHLLVPESQHLEALRPKPGVASPIMSRVDMLISIELNYEPAPVADEVADVSAEWFLTTPAAGEIPSQTLPENEFGVGQLSSKLLRSPCGKWMACESRHTPNLSQDGDRFKMVELLLPLGEAKRRLTTDD
jgi:hypothetical protein